MSDDEGNNGSKDLLAQITGDPSAMANLSQALIPTLLSSLEDALASKEKDSSVLPSNLQLQGERDRQSISRGSRMMSPQQMQGLGSNYPMGNPAQQNQTYCMGMGHAAPPFMSNAAPPFLGNAAQCYQGYAAPPPLMGNYYQGNAAPGYGNTGNAANWPMNSAGQPCTSESASTSSRGTKRSRTEQPPPSDWSVGEEEDEIDPYLSESERQDLLSDSSESESEDEEPPQKKAKFVPSEDTVKLLKSLVNKPLKNDKRKAKANKFPLPSCDPAHPPKLDESVTCLIPKSNDRFLSKLQQFCMDGMGPLIFLYEQLHKNEPLDSDTLKAAVKCSLSLMANASAHFSTERRKCIMKHLNNDLKPLAEGQFPDRGPYLFGEGFGARAKATADSIKALKGVQAQKRFSGSGDSKFKPQSRRQQWGVSSPSFQKSVFKRLGAPPTRNQSYQFRKNLKKQPKPNQ